MKMFRATSVAAATALLMMGGMVPALGQDAGICGPYNNAPCDDPEDDPEDNPGDDPDQDTEVLDDLLELQLTAADPVCIDDVPALDYLVDADESLGATSVTVSFINPSGDDIVYEGQPLSGTIVWPGAEQDADGGGIGWPGWSLEDGQWVEVDDGFAFTRKSVMVEFQVDAEVAALATSVDYPPPTSECADPVLATGGDVGTVDGDTDDETSVLGSVLARTGIDAWLLALVSVMAIGAGVVALRMRRATPNATL